MGLNDMSNLGVDSNVEEVDPKAAHTMRAINGVGITLEQQVESAHNDIRTRKGVVAGMAATSPLVDKVIGDLQKQLDEGHLDGEEAKKIIPWLVRVRDEITKSLNMNQRELAVQEGIVEGLKRAVNTCEALYKQEDVKFKVRQNEAERGNRDEGGRPLPLREVRDAEDSVSEPPKKRRRRMKSL